MNSKLFLSLAISLYLIGASSALEATSTSKRQKVKIYSAPIFIDTAKRTSFIQSKKIPKLGPVESESNRKGLNIGGESLHYTNKSSLISVFAQPLDYTHSSTSGLVNGYFVFPGDAPDINFYAGAGAGLSFYKTIDPKMAGPGSMMNSKKGVDFAYQGFVGVEKHLTGSTGLDVKVKVMNVKDPRRGKTIDGEASIGLKHNF